MIWFLGDVRGRFDHVIMLVKFHRPESVVFLGDLECSLPLDMSCARSSTSLRSGSFMATMIQIARLTDITSMAAALLNAAFMAE